MMQISNPEQLESENISSPLAVSQSIMDAALANFFAILADARYSHVLKILGVGRMQFLLRRQMVVELTGLYIALWRLALGKSFPHDAEHMFEMFFEEYRQKHAGKRGEHVLSRASGYWGMIAPHGDANFSPVARHLMSFSRYESRRAKSVELRLVLCIRRIYRLIFDRLI
jgi:hypothetical protein